MVSIQQPFASITFTYYCFADSVRAGAAWHAAGGLVPDYRYMLTSTHRHLLKMAQEEPESGVCKVHSREYVEQPPGENSALWGKAVVSNVCVLSVLL